MTAIRLSQVFTIGTLIFMVPSTIELFRREQDPAAVALNALLIGVFAAAYVGSCVWIVWDSRDHRRTLAVWVTLTVIATYFSFKPGVRMEASHIYAAVTAGAVLGPRLAIPLIVLNAAVAAAGALTAGVSVTTGIVVFFEPLLFGLLALLLSYLWTTVYALRAAREEIARLAVHEERLRFARDVHDLLGRSLSLIALKSELANRLLRDEPDRAGAEMRDVEQVARDALREVREAVTGYRQPTLAAELAGARAALHAAAVECCIENDAGVIPPDVESVLAWTVREGVTNVIRHSRAKRCDIRITRTDGRIAVEVIDDGRGVAVPVEGSGLRGLAERIAGRGGTAEAGPLPSGFRLRVTVPVAVA
ncbi:MAG TPA: histidine kinase [Candidatus Limnocylindria bacterium]|jgi:two-component system sensor histidine kinase DesK|nr:histidine kinase [Candidatus Limnocylindria bacterium]